MNGTNQGEPNRMLRRIAKIVAAAGLLSLSARYACSARAQDPSAKTKITTAEFTSPEGQAQWEFLDDGWQFVQVEKAAELAKATELRLVKKESNYQPPFRSPLHIALWKREVGGSFQLDVICKSTQADYAHRDVCLFFDFQDKSHYYYVHLGKQMDEHANQIFIVNEADRTKISTMTSGGTKWDDQWHRVRLKRNPTSGLVEVYFDDMAQAAMTAKDTTFRVGRIGVGSFDDTADFQKIELTEGVMEAQ